MSQFKLPDLGEGLPDAEIREWLVQVGDTVAVDQPLVSMETAKAVVDVPSPQAGKITKLHGEAGDVIETGSVLVEFESETSTEKADSGTVAGKIEVGTDVIAETAKIVTPAKNKTAGLKASPAVRALAQRLDVDLSSLQGSGPKGLITADDVKNAKSTSSQYNLPDATPLKGSRRMMAQAMSQSHAEVVPVTIFDQVDVSHWDQDTDITAQVVTAIVAACQAEPSLNAWFDGKANAVQQAKDVDLGLAMDTAEGLFVPVIREAQTLCQDPQALRARINDIKTLVQTRDIPQDQLQGATITLSNFGMFAGRFATPVVVPPQVAILGTGKIHQQVVVQNNESVVGTVLPLSLTFDHRSVTGGEATRFMKVLIERLGEK